MKRRFLVVDDHPVFRQGLVALIHSEPSFQVIAEAGSSAEALEGLRREQPEIALVDISLKNENGLDLVRTIRAEFPAVPVLIVSMHDEIVYAERAMKAGAKGMVMKHEPPSQVLEAIKTVLAGRVYLSESMRERLLDSMFSSSKEGQTAAPLDRLSAREIEVLEYIGQGYGAAEIATILNIAVKTVHTHQEHLKEKLNLPSSAEIRRFAVQWYRETHR